MPNAESALGLEPRLPTSTCLQDNPNITQQHTTHNTQHTTHNNTHNTQHTTTHNTQQHNTLYTTHYTQYTQHTTQYKKIAVAAFTLVSSDQKPQVDATASSSSGGKRGTEDNVAPAVGGPFGGLHTQTNPPQAGTTTGAAGGADASRQSMESTNLDYHDSHDPAPQTATQTAPTDTQGNFYLHMCMCMCMCICLFLFLFLLVCVCVCVVVVVLLCVFCVLCIVLL